MLFQMLTVTSAIVVGTALASIAFFDGVVSEITTHHQVAESNKNVPPAWTKG